MTPDPFTRRGFVGAVSAGFGGAWVAVSWPAIASAAAHAAHAVASRGIVRFRSLSPEEAAEIAAMAIRILPSDDGPGAREAGVIYFIDRALETFLRDQRPLVTSGLAELAAAVAVRHPGVGNFSALSASAQDDVLRVIERGAFFALIRRATIAGFLANPSYGGNRDGVGWRWIGFEDRFVWQAPFGYYDREDIVEP
jgi:gluconate 2-dehydrogenase gamma chain